MPDDLARWKASLAGRPDVTIRVHNADNHLFFRGTGKSSPAEYEPPQHVDPAVVADIADWLSMTTPLVDEEPPAGLSERRVYLAGGARS